MGLHWGEGSLVLDADKTVLVVGELTVDSGVLDTEDDTVDAGLPDADELKLDAGLPDTNDVKLDAGEAETDEVTVASGLTDMVTHNCVRSTVYGNPQDEVVTLSNTSLEESIKVRTRPAERNWQQSTRAHIENEVSEVNDCPKSTSQNAFGGGGPPGALGSSSNEWQKLFVAPSLHQLAAKNE